MDPPTTLRLTAALALALLALACGGDSPSPTGPDATAPAAIIDLAAESTVADSALLLSWTAPGDDGSSGTAASYEILYAPGGAGKDWADSTAIMAQAPIPGPAGTSERWVLRGLVPDDTYQVRIRTSDESGNWSGPSNTAVASVGDRVPPAPIADLRVSRVTTSRAELRWTCSGDDGLRGRATRTELRVSANPLDTTNWSEATPIQGLPDPADPGVEQSFPLEDLEATQTYYFAIRAVDDSGLLSSLTSSLRLDTPMITVRSSGGGITGHPSLRAALAGVQPNETIQLGPGIFDGRDNRDLEPRGVVVTIRGSGPQESGTVLDLEETGRAFYFRNPGDTGTVLQDLAIINGYAGPTAPGFGGAIFCFGGASPTLVNCRFENNQAVAQGGAISARNGSSPLVEQCVFRNNHSGTDGGAIGADTVSRPRIIGAIFESNEADDRGGAIALIGDSGGEIRDCTFRENRAGHHGGAVAAITSSPAIQDCLFEANVAGEGGGAILCRENASPLIDRCTLRNNRAGRWGGGIYCWIASSPTISDCLLESNESEQGGGLLSWTSSFPIIKQSTLVLNRACFGSAVRGIGPQSGARISNCILALGGIPQCQEGAGLAVHLQQDAQVVVECTAIFGNVGGDWVRWLDGQDRVNGNLAADPRFCDPDRSDFRLREDSPCLDPPECFRIGAFGACGATNPLARATGG